MFLLSRVQVNLQIIVLNIIITRDSNFIPEQMISSLISVKVLEEYQPTFMETLF